ncbi:hypothetical protein C8J56DRAFT_999961 [Mycena floridula]|nr:hypothetical protein C8J56DRAFT_999961 [Mycena floridula]
MSSTEMAQDFAGLPQTTVIPKTKTTSVQLFLPAHHHIESLHFAQSGGKPLHPALAVIQTPGREYYVLKDNGMQVGTEEDGIAELWMEIIGCNERGEKL